MKRGNDYDGTLIATEGIDGAGKSSIVDAIETWADDEDVLLVTSKEPTSFRTGDWVYTNLGDESTSAVEDFLLFCADRRAHIEWIIKHLKEGYIVVTDRYADSTRAYQTHLIADETGMSYDEARQWMEDIFTPWNIEPDITIYVDIPVDTAMERCDVGDKFETRENLERVKEAYDDMYSHCDNCVRILDGTKSLSAVTHKAVNTVKAQHYVAHDSHGRDGDGEGGGTYADVARASTSEGE